MGKHERDWVEEAEQAVANGLNGQPCSAEIQQIVSAIQNKLGNDYLRAYWVGGDNYKDPGDVHIQWSDRIDKIELKFSRASGAGTTKNLGQNTFHKKVNDSIIGYKQWDENANLRQQRYKLVESFIGRNLRNASDYCNELRKIRNSDPDHYILNQLAEITEPGQISYAQYAAQELNQCLDQVNELVHTVLTTSDIEPERQDVIFCVIKNFQSENQTVEFFNFVELDKTITNVVSSGRSIKFLNRNGNDVLRFSVTWKNICQGGSTPCFNVFVGNAFRH